MQHEKVYKYIGAIKNKKKSEYAYKYLAYRIAPVSNIEPTTTLSLMAAQAVRMRIDYLLNNP